jgi:hypothetical protein
MSIRLSNMSARTRGDCTTTNSQDIKLLFYNDVDKQFAYWEDVYRYACLRKMKNMYRKFSFPDGKMCTGTRV